MSPLLVVWLWIVTNELQVSNNNNNNNNKTLYHLIYHWKWAFWKTIIGSFKILLHQMCQLIYNQPFLFGWWRWKKKDSLDVRGNVMNLGTVFVSHNGAFCSPGICSQHHSILDATEKSVTFILGLPNHCNFSSADAHIFHIQNIKNIFRHHNMIK